MVTPEASFVLGKQLATSSQSRSELEELVKLMRLERNCSREVLVEKVSTLIKEKLDREVGQESLKTTKQEVKGIPRPGLIHPQLLEPELTHPNRNLASEYRLHHSPMASWYTAI
ncbi:hypothetical protein RIF29_13880 [Crotalaria pallida]|uniref:Uncharacterized protein n=1 Tax=Crotalaria pallida TaxID=3830 RepID=A0AAN9FCF7_CROPI